MVALTSFIPCLPLLLCSFVKAEIDQFSSDDFMSFVTRPEFKPPKFDIRIYHPNRTSSGYWFLAPYADVDPEKPSNLWSPCQVGPHIYDSNGTLVWSGACMFDNRNIFDFKVANNIDKKNHLSFILQHAYESNGKEKGAGIILNEQYEHENQVPVTNELGAFNMHEFNILDGGKTALACTYKTEEADLSVLGIGVERGRVVVGGFEEIDIATGQVIFRWSALNHVSLLESDFSVPKSVQDTNWDWDYIHVNSVDKNANGDYLLSSRFTNTLFLISGKDGHIKWRLGGKTSDFVQNFSFYRQHHARFISSNDNETVISFLDNASDEQSEDGEVSSALFVKLDTAVRPMTATVVRRYDRPDGGLTRLRGNVQTLPNGNVFVGWSEQGYHSEFAPDGTLLMEAMFPSPTFSTYRAYKFDFVGMPAEPPVLKALVYGSDLTELMSVLHVSWNGATEVASYSFYANGPADNSSVLLGSVAKSGFETTFSIDCFVDWVSVEAMDVEGNILAVSDVVRTIVPANLVEPDASWNGEIPSSTIYPANFSVALDACIEKVTREQTQGSLLDQVFAPVGALTIFVLVSAIVGSVGLILHQIQFSRNRLNRARSKCEPGGPDDDDARIRLMESTEPG